MRSTLQESIFAAILVVASAVSLVTYMLGVLLDPSLGIVISLVMVGIGVASVVPPEQRPIGAIMGLLAVVLAGVVIPRLIARATSVRDELTATLALSGLVLLLTVALLRLTVFDRAAPQPAYR